MHRYDVLSYFELLNNIDFLLVITQHNRFHNTLFSILLQYLDKGSHQISKNLWTHGVSESETIIHRIKNLQFKSVSYLISCSRLKGNYKTQMREKELQTE